MLPQTMRIEESAPVITPSGDNAVAEVLLVSLQNESIYTQSLLSDPLLRFKLTIVEYSALPRAGNWDAILLELHPYEQGLQVLKTLLQRFSEIPLVALTCSDDPQRMQHLLELGTADALNRYRCTPPLIDCVIRYAIEKRKLYARLHAQATALKRNEAQLKAIAEDIGDGIVVLDSQGYVRFVNSSAAKMLRPEFELVQGQIVSGLLFDPKQCSREIALGTPEHPRYIDLRISRTFWVGHAATTIVLRDVTERKLAEEALRQKEEELRQSRKMEAIGTLAGGVAHDLNNIMTIVVGQAEILGMRLQKHPELLQRVGEIANAGERAVELVRQLLAFSRKQQLETTVFDLNGVIENGLLLLKRLIQADVAIESNLHAEPCWVKSDPGQMQQVLLNLCVNARDAMPQGGRLNLQTTIRVFEEPFKLPDGVLNPGRYVALSVSDTGIGMDARTVSRIFEPFFTTKSRSKGTGLGLATVYGIVKQCGGQIMVSSVLGAGTTFRVYLPLAEAPERKVEVNEGTSSESTTKSCRILIVEEDDGVRDLLITCLQRAGQHVVVAVRDEVLAIRQLEDSGHVIELAIIDLASSQLPPATFALALSERLAKVRFLFLCSNQGETLQTQRQHLALLGTRCAFLEKPFTPETLLRQLGLLMADGVDR